MRGDPLAEGRAGLNEDMPPLSSSHIRYLLTIYRIDANHGEVRCIDLANALQLTKPTIHSMITTLIKMALVEHASGGAVYLTEQGRAYAHQYDGCFCAATDLFRRMLGLSEVEAQNTTYSLLSEVPFLKLAELKRRMEISNSQSARFA